MRISRKRSAKGTVSEGIYLAEFPGRRQRLDMGLVQGFSQERSICVDACVLGGWDMEVAGSLSRCSTVSEMARIKNIVTEACLYS